MPNNCVNELVIRIQCRAVEVWDAIKNNGENGPDFNKLAPYPEKFEKADKERAEFEKMFLALPEDERRARADEWKNRPQDGYNSGGYEWCQTNWGTKWNAYACKALRLPEDDEDWTIVLQFETAWGPASTIAQLIAKRWPDADVSLQFWERGMAYQGLIQWARGDRTLEFQVPYYGHRGG